MSRPLDTAEYDQPLGLASTADSHQQHKMDSKVLPVSAASLPSEPPNCFSVQIAKYMALQDAQTGLLFRDGHLPKPADVGLLAFAQSLVVTSTPALHTPAHSVSAISTATQ